MDVSITAENLIDLVIYGTLPPPPPSLSLGVAFSEICFVVLSLNPFQYIKNSDH